MKLQRFQISTFAILSLILAAATQLTAQDESASDILIEWNNGNVLPGKLIRGGEKEIFWNSNLFQGDLEIDFSALNNIRFPRDESKRATPEKYFVRTLTGDKLYGEIVKIDENGLVLKSQRHDGSEGEPVTVARDQVAKIVHLDNAGYVLMGVSDLEDWGSLKRMKRFWEISDSGDLVTTKPDINLFYMTDLPDAVQVDMVIKWQKNLDLVFGLGVPSSEKLMEKLPRIESWEDSLVFNQEDDFSILYESIEADQKRLVLQIQWDRKTNVVSIRDEKGEELCNTEIPGTQRGIENGIYIENKKGDMQIETLRISKTVAGYDPSKRAIQLTDGSVRYGEITSYNGEEWVVADPESNEESKVANNEFRTALVMGLASQDEPETPEEEKSEGDEPAEEKDKSSENSEEQVADTDEPQQENTADESDVAANTEEKEPNNILIRFQDGALLMGRLKAISEKRITIQTDFASQPVESDIAGISVIRFLNDGENEVELDGTHSLFTKYGELKGQVFAGTGEAGDVIRWKPVGCRTGLPLTNADTKIVLSNELTMTKEGEPEWPDTLYFKNKDTIPCKIVSVDEKQVVFESFAENDRVPQGLIKAIDFSALRVSGMVSCRDAGWYFSDRAKDNIEVTGDKDMIIRGPGRFGHSSLAAVGTLKFDLKWKAGDYNTLELRSFVRNAKTTSGGIGASVMMWDNMVMIGDLNRDQMMGTSQINTRGNEAKIEFEVKDGKLTIKVNGKKAMSTKISRNNMKGSAVSMNLQNHNGNNKPQVTMSNVSINSSGNGSSPVFIDEEKKTQLLTIPRLRKDNPPRHILCARNNDFLRGELVAMDENRILFESRLDRFTFERDVVSSIVWIHIEDEEKKPASEDSKEDEGKGAEGETKEDAEKAEDAGDSETSKTEEQAEPQSEEVVQADETANEDEDPNQVVQIIMKGGQRLTVNAKLWTDKTFDGVSTTLGNCSVPIEDIKELRLGKFATDATDIAYADWVAVNAKQPKLEDESGAGASGFGKQSPLIGAKAKDFSLKMLDGSTFKLSDYKGKVVVLDFWATWCSPCVKALPAMVSATDSFDSNDVIFIAVNQLESAAECENFCKGKKLEMKVGLDNGDVGDLFEVKSIPQTVIIDREGKIAFLKVGTEDDLENKMFKAIDEIKDGKHNNPDSDDAEEDATE